MPIVITAVNFDSQGNLYATNGFGEVFRVNYETGEHQVVTVLPIGIDNLAIDPEDNIYVINFFEGAIYKIDVSTPDPEVIQLFKSGGLYTPGGLALYEDEDDGLF